MTDAPDRLRPEERGLQRLRRAELIALAALIWFLARFLRYAFPPLFEPLQGVYGVSAAGTLVAAAGALALVVNSPFPALVAAMLLVEAGTGVHKTVAVRLLARVYPVGTGRAVGVVDTVGALDGVAAPAVVVFALGLHGAFGAPWRTLFLATGLATAGLAIAFALGRARGWRTARWSSPVWSRSSPATSATGSASYRSSSPPSDWPRPRWWPSSP